MPSPFFISLIFVLALGTTAESATENIYRFDIRRTTTTRRRPRTTTRRPRSTTTAKKPLRGQGIGEGKESTLDKTTNVVA
ncbi:hypothetical protein PFISCL1PPCAC_28529 [Pristionchus fissidentatus]|uniref:Uncharacterized protein n=1 Tax=Pristionchus fissidentatus TaxID=1538716 RepID=A0AAV5X1J1_9BILA|nr:hypothetical protein PFISCL1PPCAC_28529 [Pristionchus fissidentatus]